MFRSIKERLIRHHSYLKQQIGRLQNLPSVFQRFMKGLENKSDLKRMLLAVFQNGLHDLSINKNRLRHSVHQLHDMQIPNYNGLMAFSFSSFSKIFFRHENKIYVCFFFIFILEVLQM